MSNAKIAVSGNDLKNNDQVSAYISCEGGDFLDDDVDHLDEAYLEGVRSVQLVHYAPNTLGDLQTWKVVHGGLTVFGKEVVTRMNKLGMVIDVAHASARTVKDVADLTDAPIILSHSILKENDDRPIEARAINKGHALLVSQTGGVIGMWPSGFSNSLDEFVEATFKMVDVVGIDHVGLGTDMDGNFKPVISNYGDFITWKEALSEKGMNKEEIGKISGGNMQRVLDSILK